MLKNFQSKTRLERKQLFLFKTKDSFSVLISQQMHIIKFYSLQIAFLKSRLFFHSYSAASMFNKALLGVLGMRDNWHYTGKHVCYAKFCILCRALGVKLWCMKYGLPTGELANNFRDKG